MSNDARRTLSASQIAADLRNDRHKICVVGEPCQDCQALTQAADTIESLQVEVEHWKERWQESNETGQQQATEYEALQAEVERLRRRNHHLHSRLTYETAQRIALTERLQELDPPEEVHGT